MRNNVSNHFFDLRFREARVDAIVDGDGRRGVAAAEAGAAADGDVGAAEILQAIFETRPQIVCAAQVAGHVLADGDIGFRRRREAEMRIEAGDAVEAIERNVDFRGEIL